MLQDRPRGRLHWLQHRCQRDSDGNFTLAATSTIPKPRYTPSGLQQSRGSRSSRFPIKLRKEPPFNGGIQSLVVLPNLCCLFATMMKDVLDCDCLRTKRRGLWHFRGAQRHRSSPACTDTQWGLSL
eukprot:3515526-Amphidinium_carterae.1